MTATTESPPLLVEHDGAALRITLNRPQSLNSANASMLNALKKALDRAASDESVRVVVLTGAGRAFCSGADVAGGSRGGGDENSSGSTLSAANRAVLAIRALEKPVVAAVNGVAAGVGTSLALACDLVLATSGAYFLLAFTNIGLMPDGGATALIPAAIGRARALRMALLAERIPAQTAAEWGLISHVIDDAAFSDEVAAVVAKLAGGPPLAYAETKRAINSATIDQLAAALDRETAAQEKLVRSKDFIEGASAFTQKRRPTFTGT